ncbi:MAG: hypothetical protein GY835_11730 [bacterium]|nr:hypothetical protein [bacterium]
MPAGRRRSARQGLAASPRTRRGGWVRSNRLDGIGAEWVLGMTIILYPTSAAASTPWQPRQPRWGGRNIAGAPRFAIRPTSARRGHGSRLQLRDLACGRRRWRRGSGIADEYHRGEIAPLRCLAISLRMLRRQSPGLKLVVSYADSKEGFSAIQN